jgi:putative spermidine/putrescine transport system ATP-binding protein
MSLVEIRDLALRYGETTIFEGINLDIDQGQMCVLVGPSGCGKTTLLRAVAGLVTPEFGRIMVADRDITRLPVRQRGVGMVFQHYALFPNMTVEQNLAFGLEQQSVSGSEIARRVRRFIDLMGLGPRAKAKPAALSGGQQQRVALARALVLEPKLVLLDEPMSALDAQIRKRLREELKRLQKEIGFTAVFVTHDQEEALILGDKIAVMQSGRLCQVGTPIDVYNRPASKVVAEFLGDFNVLDPPAVERAFGLKSDNSWAIHPGAIVVSEANPGLEPRKGCLCSKAEITELKMMGLVVRYTLDAAGIPIKADALNKRSNHLWEIGVEVEFHVDEADICVLND